MIENAFLEVNLELPSDPRATGEQGSRFAVVRVQTADVSFDENWESSDAMPAVPLTASAKSELRFSVEGLPETETKAIRIKVRFCGDESCTDLRDDRAPEVRYEVERAFYLGKSTSLELSIPCIPNVDGETDPPPACAIVNQEIIDIEKCDVAGCREGVTSSYCVADKHFCEE